MKFNPDCINNTLMITSVGKTIYIDIHTLYRCRRELQLPSYL